MEIEKAHLMNIFLKNGYKRHQAIKAIKNANKETCHKNIDKNDFVGKVNLPYILGTIDKIAHILKKNNILTTFKPLNTIWSCLKFVKDPIDPKCQKGVYLIPCSYGIPYVGETGRYIKTRTQEHSVDIKNNRSKNSALAKHSNKTEHQICSKKTSILAKIDYYFHIKFREAIEISKHLNNLNKDEGWRISKN